MKFTRLTLYHFLIKKIFFSSAVLFLNYWFNKRKDYVVLDFLVRINSLLFIFVPKNEKYLLIICTRKSFSTKKEIFL